MSPRGGRGPRVVRRRTPARHGRGLLEFYRRRWEGFPSQANLKRNRRLWEGFPSQANLKRNSPLSESDRGEFPLKICRRWRPPVRRPPGRAQFARPTARLPLAACRSVGRCQPVRPRALRKAMRALRIGGTNCMVSHTLTGAWRGSIIRALGGGRRGGAGGHPPPARPRAVCSPQSLPAAG